MVSGAIDRLNWKKKKRFSVPRMDFFVRFFFFWQKFPKLSTEYCHHCVTLLKDLIIILAQAFIYVSILHILRILLWILIHLWNIVGYEVSTCSTQIWMLIYNLVVIVDCRSWYSQWPDCGLDIIVAQTNGVAGKEKEHIIQVPVHRPLYCICRRGLWSDVPVHTKRSWTYREQAHSFPDRHSLSIPVCCMAWPIIAVMYKVLDCLTALSRRYRAGWSLG